MNLRTCIVAACLVVACGGVSGTSDGNGERTQSRLASDDAKQSDSAEDASSETPAPQAPATVTTIVIPAPAPPPVAPAPVAAPASNSATQPASALVPVPVDPNTWLDSDDGAEDIPFAGDAGLDAGLRVDDLTVLVIFDNSSSMSAYWDGGTRWEVANRSLVRAIEPVQTSLKVGAIRFPIGETCGVPGFDSGEQFGFELGEDFLAHWVQSGLAPAGSTPLSQAFVEADKAIANASEMGLLEDRFNVVVITDGEPNCDGNNALLTALPSKWHELGVATVVLGLPGSSQAEALLDAIAEAGGTHTHQSLGTADELDRSVTAAAR
jgi:hypothetical protein